MKNKIFLAVDFDGTIARKEKVSCPIADMRGVQEQLVLIEGAKEALQALRDKNCYILIDSNRANSYRKKEGTVERSLNEMKEFLDVNQVPYDAIAGLTFKVDGKPIADFYISHNNIQLTTWDKIIPQILGEK